MTKTSSGYSRIQISLHWIIALLVLLEYAGGDFASELIRRVGLAGLGGPDTPLLANAHAWVGVAILALMALRLIVRIVHGAPALPAEEDPRLKLVAKATHILLYAVLLLAPIAGMMEWYWHISAGVWLHDGATTVLAALIYLHIAAALYHQFILKNELIKRMMKAG